MQSTRIESGIGFLQLVADDLTRSKQVPLIIKNIYETGQLLQQAVKSRDGCAPGFEYEEQRIARHGDLFLHALALAMRTDPGSAQEARIAESLTHWRHEPSMQHSWVVNRVSILCIAIRRFNYLYGCDSRSKRLAHQSCLVLAATVKVLACEPFHIEDLERAIKEGII